ncbi:uncharacterized protein MONBRDRAFT_5669 [Monosiga brevicollis MX1]|uniref:Uncharacterized protein n=1 Tax=Monosiga brevicollis TaxID=81824 RepID=A9US40_MONBE|nr:uncharacterized protein MONBRDRAFT_5669 [Monosiga brevicollis MX1]EDQ91712.1 predicted protein [Monosiga brevicollis MX1]|eukprot:XP_001742998.1 hypothetical protein [Monosiga brevicollis MX1]
MARDRKDREIAVPLDLGVPFRLFDRHVKLRHGTPGRLDPLGSHSLRLLISHFQLPLRVSIEGDVEVDGLKRRFVLVGTTASFQCRPTLPLGQQTAANLPATPCFCIYLVAVCFVASALHGLLLQRKTTSRCLLARPLNQSCSDFLLIPLDLDVRFQVASAAIGLLCLTPYFPPASSLLFTLHCIAPRRALRD